MRYQIGKVLVLVFYSFVVLAMGSGIGLAAYAVFLPDESIVEVPKKGLAASFALTFLFAALALWFQGKDLARRMDERRDAVKSHFEKVR